MSLARSAPVGFVDCYPTMSILISIAVLTAIANAAQFFIASPPRCDLSLTLRSGRKAA